jgi:hypothetical protein
LVVPVELPPGVVVLEEPPELMPPELDEPELMPPEAPELEVPPAALGALLSLALPPAAPCLKNASHSERLIWPLWSLSSLLKSSCDTDLCSPEAPAAALLPDEDDVPPAADDVPPAADDLSLVDAEPLADGVLLCDVDGEALEPELDFFASSA